MKKAVIIAIFCVIVFGLAHEDSHGNSPEITWYHYRCTSNNESLFFTMYENGGQFYGGNMYIEDITVAKLSFDSSLSEGNLVAKINMDIPNVQVSLSPDRILIINASTHTAKQLCKCSYKTITIPSM